MNKRIVIFKKPCHASDSTWKVKATARNNPSSRFVAFKNYPKCYRCKTNRSICLPPFSVITSKKYRPSAKSFGNSMSCGIPSALMVRLCTRCPKPLNICTSTDSPSHADRSAKSVPSVGFGKSINCPDAPCSEAVSSLISMTGGSKNWSVPEPSK